MRGERKTKPIRTKVVIGGAVATGSIAILGIGLLVFAGRQQLSAAMDELGDEPFPRTPVFSDELFDPAIAGAHEGGAANMGEVYG